MPKVRTCEYFEKKILILKYQKCERSGPVELLEKMQEYIKCAIGPDLWLFWEKTFIFKYKKFDRSGPVELPEKMLEYIKCATGPGLWIFWEKTFILKYQKCDRSGPVVAMTGQNFLIMQYTWSWYQMKALILHITEIQKINTLALS